LAEPPPQPVETSGNTERVQRPARFPAAMLRQGEPPVNADKDSGTAPPPVISAPPERELERKLKLSSNASWSWNPAIRMPRPTSGAMNPWTLRIRRRQRSQAVPMNRLLRQVSRLNRKKS